MYRPSGNSFDYQPDSHKPADTGCISQLSSQTIGVEEKRSIIDERVSMHNFQRGNIISEDGTSIFDGKD